MYRSLASELRHAFHRVRTSAISSHLINIASFLSIFAESLHPCVRAAAPTQRHRPAALRRAADDIGSRSSAERNLDILPLGLRLWLPAQAAYMQQPADTRACTTV